MATVPVTALVTGPVLATALVTDWKGTNSTSTRFRSR
jgi:hypothetical protein